jgi:hypothetical protein
MHMIFSLLYAMWSKRQLKCSCDIMKDTPKVYSMKPEECEPMNGPYNPEESVNIQLIEEVHELPVTGFRCHVRETSYVSVCGHYGTDYGEALWPDETTKKPELSLLCRHCCLDSNKGEDPHLLRCLFENAQQEFVKDDKGNCLTDANTDFISGPTWQKVFDASGYSYGYYEMSTFKIAIDWPNGTRHNLYKKVKFGPYWTETEHLHISGNDYGELYWNKPEENCKDGLQVAYAGPAKVLRPKLPRSSRELVEEEFLWQEQHIGDMTLVFIKDLKRNLQGGEFLFLLSQSICDRLSSTFSGLKLKDLVLVCGHPMYPTNIDGVSVVFQYESTTNWFEEKSWYPSAYTTKNAVTVSRNPFCFEGSNWPSYFSGNDDKYVYFKWIGTYEKCTWYSACSMQCGAKGNSNAVAI